MPEKHAHKHGERDKPHGPRPFWAGTITFGLVSLPVNFFVATRRRAIPSRSI